MTCLRLPDGGRAACLLAQVDACWLELVAGLPPRLRELARDAGTFQGTAGGRAPFRGPSAMNPGITCTPWLFWEMAQQVDDDSFVALALAGSLTVLASVLLDHLVDGQAASPGDTALLHQALREAGTARLRARFPSSHPLWQDLERLGAEHVAGLAEERESQEHPEQLSFERFVAMVPGKFSPIAATMAAFAHACGRPECLAPVEASIKRLAVASQLLDDLGDWEEDLEKGHLTFFLAGLVPAAEWAGPGRPAVEEMRQRIDERWADIRALETVLEWLSGALEAVQGLECADWKEYLGGYQVLAGQHLTRCKAQRMLRVLEPLVG